MSVAIAGKDLSTAQVGSTGSIDWTGQVQTGSPIGVGAGRAAMRLLNESGAGLIVTVGRSSSHVPAGGWQDYQLTGENNLSFEVEYLIVGPSPNLLLATIYEPGEKLPPPPVLGNSPVGVGGTINTSNSNILKNDGNSPGSEFIEATPSDQAASSVTINNDASGFLKVLSANVLRTILSVVRGNATTTKASVQLGDSGDTSITTLYGTLGAGSVVPAATIAGVLPAAQVGTGYPGADVTGTVPSATLLQSGSGQGSGVANSWDSVNRIVQMHQQGFSAGDVALALQGYDKASNTENTGVQVNHDGSVALALAQWLISAAGALTAPAGAIPASAVGTGYPGADVSGAVASATTASSVPASGVTAGSFPPGVNLSVMAIDIEAGSVIERPVPATDPIIRQTSDGVTSHNFTFGADGSFTLQSSQVKAPGAVLGAMTIGSTNPYVLMSGGGGFSSFYGISGSGSATVSIALPFTPFAALVNANNGSNSTTFGSGSYTTTSVFIYQFSAMAWRSMIYV